MKMSSLMIIYLLGCATAFVQIAARIYIGRKKEQKHIVVGDIFQLVYAILTSWIFVAYYIVSNHPEIWNKVIIKSKEKKE